MRVEEVEEEKEVQDMKLEGRGEGRWGMHVGGREKELEDSR